MPAHPRPGRLVGQFGRPLLGVFLAGILLPAWVYLSTMVRAVTLATEPAAVACTLCVLDPQGTGVQMSGNGQLLVHWGSVVVDSSASAAVQLSGNAAVQSSESEVVGGLEESGNASMSPAFAQVPAPGDLDPFAALSEPTPGSSPSSFQATGHQRVTASPGTYSTFQVSGQAVMTLSPGVYVITQGFQVSGQATVSGSGVMLFFAGQAGLQLSGGSTLHLTSSATGTYAGIALMYDRSDTSALRSTGNGSPSQRYVGGAVYAASGVLGGSGSQELQVDGPVVVGSVELSGGGTVLIDNVEAAQTVTGATLTPTLGLALTSSEQSTIPGDTVTYSATVSNDGAGLAVTGTVTATNNDATTATVAAYSETLQTASTGTCSAASNHGQTTVGWSDLAGTGGALSGYSPLEPAPATGMTLSLTPQPATGVTYPSSGDPMLGTTIAAGDTASWEYTATVPLTPAQVTTLLTASQVAQTRDSFHVEVLAGGQTQRAGQLDTVNTGFCQLFQPGVSGNVTDVSATVTPPSGPVVTVGPNQVAALASLAPGATATGKVPFTVPVVAAKGATETDSSYLTRLEGVNGSTLTATATASGTAYSGTVSAPSRSVTVTEAVPVVTIQKSGPAQAQAGTTASYSIALRNEGGATALSPSVTDGFPDGTAETVSGVPSSLAAGAGATATSSYAIPASQPAGPLTDTASVTWSDANANAYGPLSSGFTTQVQSSYQGATLTLSPPTAGPDVVGTTQTLTATFLDQSGSPIAGQSIDFSITGANPQTGTATTNSSGVASFTYTGTADGSDTVQATFTSGTLQIQSNTATVGWVTPVEAVSTTSVTGRFYSGGCGYVCANVSQPPLWTETFPTIDFNPPAGTIPGNPTGVGVNSRPMVDITTNDAGVFTGSETAAGNGYQAGVGSLYQFDAVFTGNYVVAAAGEVTFTFYDDDGFVLGIGGGATRVSGDDYNPPAQTELEGYPVMGGYNDPTSPSGHSITVDFPRAGEYPYEVDYSECCGGQLAVTMATTQSNLGVPPAGNLSLSPVSVSTQPVGGTVNLTVTAMDASGEPIAGLPVDLTVSGANAQQVTGTTNGQGVAVLSYVGANAGTDQDQVGASISGMPAISNLVEVPWAYSASTATGSSSSGTAAAPPPAITPPSPADGTVITAPTPVTASITSPSGETITQWSVTYQAADPEPAVTIASGTGTPPTPLATFDPTLLSNDTYTITVSATASGGGTQSVSTTVAVSGNLKLGRYVAMYQDMDVPVNGLQMQVLRTYDSFDRRVSDFGYGWTVGISDFRVSSNRELGAGGWTEYATSCFIICSYGYKTSVAHFVTVTWPDGHQDVFQFTPTGPHLTLIDFQTGTAGFTMVSGQDEGATLAVTDPGEQTFYPGWDGNLYTDSSESALYNPTEFTLTLRSGATYVLSTTSGLISEKDANGNSLTVSSTGITSSDGHSITFTRDSQGRITAITGPGGAIDTYNYDAAGNLASSTDADGNTTTYAYDANHDLLSATGPGATEPFQQEQYDQSGRLVAITNGDGQTVQISSDPGARTGTFTDPADRLTLVDSYDARGDLIEEQAIGGGTTRTSTWTYNSEGQVTSVTDPLGNTQSYGYDADGNLISSTDASGRTTQETYDAQGNLTSVIAPDGTVEETLTYDSAGNPLTVTLADGSTWTYTYDSAGRLLTSTDPLGNTTRWSYNALGQPVTLTNPDGQTTTVTWTSADRIAAITDPDGATTRFGYDGNGDQTSVTDPNGNTTTTSYNYLGKVTAVTDPTGQSDSYTYDAAGNLVSATDRSGRTLSFGYDADDRLITETGPGVDLSYAYDAFGDLTQAVDQSEQLDFTYDADGDVLSQTTQGTSTSPQPATTLAYAYDPDGDVTSVTGPDGTVGYGYNSLGELSSVTDPQGGTFQLGYDGEGLLTSLTRPNGVDDSVSYDAAGDLLSRVSSLDGTTVDESAYTYDPAGLRTSETTLSGTTAYGYNADGQLTSATPASGPAETYSYDPVGNLLTSSDASYGTGTFNAADELTSDASNTYAYDADGDLTSITSKATGAVTNLIWNALHELVSVEEPGGSTSTY